MKRWRVIILARRVAREARDLAERISGRSGDGNGGDDSGFDHAKCEERGAETADNGLQRLGKFGGLKIVRGHGVGK